MSTLPAPASAAEDQPKTGTKLPKTVVGLGLVSLFTDVSSEAIFPLLPVFLTTLGASNAIIGLIEGAAALVANVLKYLTGLVADRRARLKPPIMIGYGVSAPKAFEAVISDSGRVGNGACSERRKRTRAGGTGYGRGGRVRRQASVVAPKCWALAAAAWCFRRLRPRNPVATSWLIF